MMDFEAIFKARQAKQTFFNNHPKLEPFVDTVKAKGFCEGMEIAVAVKYPDGEVHKTGIRLTGSDMDLFNALQSIRL